MRDRVAIYKIDAEQYIKQLKAFIETIAQDNLQNEQWFLNFLDALNKLSVEY